MKLYTLPAAVAMTTALTLGFQTYASSSFDCTSPDTPASMCLPGTMFGSARAAATGVAAEPEIEEEKAAPAPVYRAATASESAPYAPAPEGYIYVVDQDGNVFMMEDIATSR